METIDISTFTLCIVGARWHIPADALKPWLDGIVGKSIYIKRDTQNVHDPFAVGAWAWVGDEPRLVGYVRSEDRSLACRLILANGGRRLRLRVERLLGDHGTLTASVSGIVPVPEDAVELAPKWTEWTTASPLLNVPDRFEQELFVADEIDDLLQEGMDADRDLLSKRIKTYIKLSDFDISLETRQQREKIKAALRSRKDADDWRDVRGELRRQCGLVGNETCGGEVWKIWMDLIRHPNFSPFKRDKLPSRTETEEALYKFPLDMWTTWVAEPDKFVSRLYYACIPRKVLWSFISTIAFYNLLTSTTAPNIVLTPWGVQSKEMPDNVLGGLYTGMEWLKNHGNDIPAAVLCMMSDEIKQRLGTRQQKKEDKAKPNVYYITHLDSFVNNNEGKVINNDRQQ